MASTRPSYYLYVPYIHFHVRVNLCRKIFKFFGVEHEAGFGMYLTDGK